MKKELDEKFNDIDGVLKTALKIGDESVSVEGLEFKLEKRESLSRSFLHKIPLTIVFSAVILLFLICYDLVFETSFFSTLVENVHIYIGLIVANLIFEYFIKKRTLKTMKSYNVDLFFN